MRLHQQGKEYVYPIQSFHLCMGHSVWHSRAKLDGQLKAAFCFDLPFQFGKSLRLDTVGKRFHDEGSGGFWSGLHRNGSQQQVPRTKID